MTETLPGEIVARATALGEAVQAYARTHRTGTLAEHESAVLEVVRAALPELLSGVLTVALHGGTPGAASARQPCPGCGQPCGVQSWRARRVQTRCGTVRYERPWCHCRCCRHGWSVFDQRLEVSSGSRVSRALEESLVRLGGRLSFAEGAHVLHELTGLRVAPETIRQHTEGVGIRLRLTRLAAQEDAAIAQVERTRDAAEPVDAAPGQLAVEIDGVKIAYREPTGELSATGRERWQTAWHEVKVAVVGGVERAAEAADTGAAAGAAPEAAAEHPAPLPLARWGSQTDSSPTVHARSYVAAREPSEAFGRRVAAEAARRGALTIVGWAGSVLGHGLALLRLVLVLGDGAPWIWVLAATHFGQRIEIVDWFHAVKHLTEAAHARFGTAADPATLTAWLTVRQHELRHHGVAPILQALRGTSAVTPEAQDVLRRARTYFRMNAARMTYAAFRQQGLPIGSGEVEGAGRSLVQQRMKRPGMRWSESGAHAVLTVRCRLASNRPLAA